MKCLDRAVQSLSSDSIRPVYLLLSGVESSYLDILPFDILYDLQSQMKRVLTSVDSDDHLASLLCLAVLAKLSSRPAVTEESQPNVHTSLDDPVRPESADRFLPARNFFSSRVSKTLDLVVIKAITACSQSCQLSTHEVVESLKLSREIVNAFNKKERNDWLAGNIKKVNKLHDKVFTDGIKPGVQCEVCRKRSACSFSTNVGIGSELPCYYVCGTISASGSDPESQEIPSYIEVTHP